MVEDSVEGLAFELKEKEWFVFPTIARHRVLTSGCKFAGEVLSNEAVLTAAPSVEGVAAEERIVTRLYLLELLELLASKFGALRHNDFITNLALTSPNQIARRSTSNLERGN